MAQSVTAGEEYGIKKETAIAVAVALAVAVAVAGLICMFVAAVPYACQSNKYPVGKISNNAITTNIGTHCVHLYTSTRLHHAVSSLRPSLRQW